MATSYIKNMTPEHKQAWIDALRSGDYTQGKGKLKTEEGRYCCLGVLTAITEGIEITNDGVCVNNEDYSALVSLVDTEIWLLNDQEEKTFNEIADILEAED